MIGKIFQNVKVAGIACAVPKQYKATRSYVDYFGSEKIEKFIEATGIEGRHLSDGNQTTADLCFVAAENLMREKKVSNDEIDALVLITQKPDYRTPATSFVLHKRLELREDCLVFDVNLGCSGFINGIYFLSGLIESGTINKALLLVGDADTRREISEDPSTTMMFGDAGAAILLEPGEGTIHGMIRSDGSGFRTLICPVPGYRFPGIYPGQDERLIDKMDGNDTFLFTITKVPKLFKEFYKEFSVSETDYDYYILHQANLMIVNQIAKKLKLPPEKVPISLGEYGNTDGATIPVGIVALHDSLKEGQRVKLITSGFGIGLSWGIIDFSIKKEDILPMIVTDEYYLEGKNV